MLLWIQVLRGIAASMVVFHHYVASQSSKLGPLAPWLDVFGGSGTDIFFVISGFIMMSAIAGKHSPPSAREFLQRRLIRIAPVYWVLTVAAYALGLLWAGAVNSKADFSKFFMSMLFLPYSAVPISMEAQGYKAYVISMAWTLTYEWYFYLLFAVTLMFKVNPATRLFFFAIFFAVACTLGVLFQPESLILQVATNPLTFEFLFGCLVAILFQRGIRIGPMPACAIAAAALAVLAAPLESSSLVRTMVWGIAAFALVSAAALCSEAGARYAARPLLRLGDISYSLYLTHFFTVAAFVRLQARFKIFENGYGPVAVASFILLCIIGAEICYRLIEEPTRRFFSDRRAQISTAT